MGQVQKIRVLDEGLRSFRRVNDLRRRVPTTLICVPGWSGVPRVTTLDLDVIMWMGGACNTSSHLDRSQSFSAHTRGTNT